MQSSSERPYYSRNSHYEAATEWVWRRRRWGTKWCATTLRKHGFAADVMARALYGGGCPSEEIREELKKLDLDATAVVAILSGLIADPPDVMHYDDEDVGYLDSIPLPPDLPAVSLFAASPARPEHACGNLTQLHAAKSDPRLKRALAPYCGKWDCSQCGPWRKRVWTSDIELRLLMQPAIYVTVIDGDAEKRVDTISKALRRVREKEDGRGHGYVRFAFDEREIVMASVEVSGSDKVDRKDAANLAAAIIQALPFGKHISTSRSWQLTKNDTNTRQWAVEEYGLITPDKVERKLLRFGIACSPVSDVGFIKEGRGTARSTEFVTPEQWRPGSLNYANLIAHLKTEDPESVIRERERAG